VKQKQIRLVILRPGPCLASGNGVSVDHNHHFVSSGRKKTQQKRDKSKSKWPFRIQLILALRPPAMVVLDLAPIGCGGGFCICYAFPDLLSRTGVERSLFFPDWYVGGETGHGKMTMPRHAGTDLLGPAFLRGSAGMGQSWGLSLRNI
jgi:hypothetical protein